VAFARRVSVKIGNGGLVLGAGLTAWAGGVGSASRPKTVTPKASPPTIATRMMTIPASTPFPRLGRTGVGPVFARAECVCGGRFACGWFACEEVVREGARRPDTARALVGA
jgi:hypothetical protein